jgi:hypothetical protein
MTRKRFGLRGLVPLPFGPTVPCKCRWFLAVSSGVLLLSGCVTLFRPTGPVLYEPSCDLRPVLALHLPEQIDSLARLPRTETVFQGGTNRLGGRLPDEIKEKLYLRKDATEYMFILFYSEAAASREYRRDHERHVFCEVRENGLTGRVHYTEQPRADPEGGSVPLSFFVSRADFRLRNLYIKVETKARVEEGESPQNEKLSNAVKDLAEMLRRAFETRQ